MSNYSELLKSPKWQKKRLEILERDEFKCQACGEKEKTLHVHHVIYDNSLKPWEYSNWKLITLCEDCHKLLHRLDKLGFDIDHVGIVSNCMAKFERQHYEEWCKNSKDG